MKRSNGRKTQSNRLRKRINKVIDAAKAYKGKTFFLVRMGHSDEEITQQLAEIKKTYRPGIDSIIEVDWED